MKKNENGAVLNDNKEALLKYKKDKLVYRKIEELCKHVKDLKLSLSTMNDRITNLENK
jgi:DNA-binding transcriptional regulator YhcF (GntR family)